MDDERRTTNVLLIGYGAMGRELERLAPAMHCEVVGIADMDRPLADVTSDFDVAIDFTQPDAAVDNVRAVTDRGKNIVIGTTGWYDRINEVRDLQQASDTGIVVGSNFSVGVQVFFQVVQNAAALINDIDEFDVMLHEWHHRRKKDSPSGTAITAANFVLNALDRKSHLATETQHGVIDLGALHVTSTRGGEVVGRHQLTIDGPSDTIDIIHNAKDRQGFAKGALLAATWIHGKQGMFDFTQVFPDIIRSLRS